MVRRSFLWLGVMLALGACTHAPASGGVSSRTEVGDALRARGFLPADAPPGTTYNAALLAFQKSEGLPQTGYPDPATLQKLGIDPATVDKSLDPTPHWPPGSAGAGLH